MNIPMMMTLRRDISVFLLTLRQSLDRPSRFRGFANNDERERYTRTLLLIEEIRIRFNHYSRSGHLTVSEWGNAREELLSFCDKFLNAEFIDPSMYERPFIPSSSMRKDTNGLFINNLADPNRRISIGQSVYEFKDYVKGLDVNISNSEPTLSLSDLDKIVPHQQIAPVQFDVVDGRIVIANLIPKTNEEDRSNISAALDHIRGSGEQLLENLKNSNCDRRLLDSVNELHSQILLNGNVVKIGLMNMSCGIVGSGFTDELPTAINGMLTAYHSSISLYVSQFPEWDQFAQKAAALDINEIDVAEVDAAAEEIIVTLGKNSDLADPEVPKTIEFVRQFLKYPGASSKRAVYAMIRTIENLVSSIVRHSINFLNNTGDELSKSGSKLAAKVIIGLLSVALVGAAGIGPSSMQIGSSWVTQAAEVVQKQIETIGK